MGEPTVQPSRPFPGLERAVVEALRRISRAMERHSHALEHQVGLTVPQLAVLRQLKAAEPLSIGDLTRSVHLSQATVTGILDRLERRGLVRRRRDARDRRKVHVRLTEAGAEAVRRAPPLLHERFLAALGGLPDWEQMQILATLQRVVALMESAGATAGPSAAPATARPWKGTGPSEPAIADEGRSAPAAWPDRCLGGPAPNRYVGGGSPQEREIAPGSPSTTSRESEKG